MPISRADAPLRAAIGLDPKYGLAQVQLGHALLATGHRQEAVEFFKTGYRLQPDHPKTKGLPAQLAALGLKVEL